MAIDPVSLPPAPRDRAPTADGLVTLRTPLGTDRALSVVEELFRRIVVKDAEGLGALFTSDAVSLSSPLGSSASQRSLLFWERRFRQLDYTKLAGENVYRESEIEVYRGAEELEAASAPPTRTDPLAPTDVLIRVPIAASHVGSDRLFGEEIIFWLRREGDRYKIYRTLEDFQLN